MSQGVLGERRKEGTVAVVGVVRSGCDPGDERVVVGGVMKREKKKRSPSRYKENYHRDKAASETE